MLCSWSLISPKPHGPAHVKRGGKEKQTIPQCSNMMQVNAQQLPEKRKWHRQNINQRWASFLGAPRLSFTQLESPPVHGDEQQHDESLPTMHIRKCHLNHLHKNKIMLFLLLLGSCKFMLKKRSHTQKSDYKLNRLTWLYKIRKPLFNCSKDLPAHTPSETSRAVESYKPGPSDSFSSVSKGKESLHFQLSQLAGSSFWRNKYIIWLLIYPSHLVVKLAGADLDHCFSTCLPSSAWEKEKSFLLPATSSASAGIAGQTW